MGSACLDGLSTTPGLKRSGEGRVGECQCILPHLTLLLVPLTAGSSHFLRSEGLFVAHEVLP